MSGVDPLREAIPSDAPHLLNVMIAAITETGRAAYAEDQIEAWRSNLPQPGETEALIQTALSAPVIEDRKGIYAFCTLLETGHIQHLMCHPRKARTGAASRLLQQAEIKAAEKGLDALTAHASLIAKPVFLRNGYSVVHEEEKFGLIRFLVEKKLL